MTLFVRVFTGPDVHSSVDYGLYHVEITADHGSSMRLIEQSIDGVKSEAEGADTPHKVCQCLVRHSFQTNNACQVLEKGLEKGLRVRESLLGFPHIYSV